MKNKVAIALLIISFGLFIYVFSTNAQKPFESDGCTLFPDSFWGVSWGSCCEVHDQQYFKGGTYQERYESDVELGQCVAEVSHPAVGWLMKKTVRVTGTPYMPTYFRWGFGDEWGNFYQ